MPSVDYEAALRIQNAARQIPGGIDALMNGRAEDLLNERANALAMAQGSEERRTAMLTSAIGMMTQQAQRKDDRSFMAELEQKKMEFAERMAAETRQHEERMLMLQIGAKRRGGGGGRKTTSSAGDPSEIIAQGALNNAQGNPYQAWAMLTSEHGVLIADGKSEEAAQIAKARELVQKKFQNAAPVPGQRLRVIETPGAFPSAKRKNPATPVWNKPAPTKRENLPTPIWNEYDTLRRKNPVTPVWSE